MLSTKNLYMKACMQSKELHAMTDDERLHLQAHLRMMYQEIEKVCDRHNLQMSTGYGSVLGALRHKGFIPWDDDMDLVMPREDYDKLINLYADELPDNFKIYAPNSKNGPIARFAKVVDTKTRFLGPGTPDEEEHGIFIDIFPLEGTSKNRIAIWIKHKVSCLLMLISSSVMEYESSKSEPDNLYEKLMCSTKEGKKTYIIRHIIGKTFSFFNSKIWFNIVEDYTKCSKVKAGYSVPVGGANVKYFKPIAPNVYFPARKVRFNDIEVYVPNLAERHCEIEYGDWKRIPPIEDRWQHFLTKIVFVISFFLVSTFSFAQEINNDQNIPTTNNWGAKLKSSNFNLGLDLQTKYIWRGMEMMTEESAPVLFPSVSYQYNGLYAYVMGGYAVNGKYAEVDLGVSYTWNGITVGIYDYYYPTIDSKTDKYLGGGKHSGHWLEISATYAPVKIPLWLTASNFFYGADKYQNEEGNDKQAYSTYLELGTYYDFLKNNRISLAVGAALNKSCYNGYEHDFSVCNIETKYTYNIVFKNDWTLPLGVSYIYNPVFDKSFVNFTACMAF